MPWADKAKTRAAIRDWMRRHPEKAKEYKRRYEAKRKRLRVRIVRPLDKYVKVTREQKNLFYKLRRNGLSLREAQIEAYGPDWVPPNRKKRKPVSQPQYQHKESQDEKAESHGQHG